MGILLLSTGVSHFCRWREPGGGVRKEGTLMGRTIVPDTWDGNRYDCHWSIFHTGTKYRAQTIYPQ